MAKFQFKGLEEWAEKLQEVGANTEDNCGKAVYKMAEIVADEVRERIEALSAASELSAIIAYKEKQLAPLTRQQKQGLKDGFGISSMQNTNGYWHVKLGFDGYNSVRTKAYPNGQPNVLIARSVESGSSIREKKPFIRPAVNAAREKAIEEAKRVIDEEIQNIMND